MDSGLRIPLGISFTGPTRPCDCTILDGVILTFKGAKSQIYAELPEECSSKNVLLWNVRSADTQERNLERIKLKRSALETLTLKVCAFEKQIGLGVRLDGSIVFGHAFVRRYVHVPITMPRSFEDNQSYQIKVINDQGTLLARIEKIEQTSKLAQLFHVAMIILADQFLSRFFIRPC